MRLNHGQLLYSPSDITNHILCQHLTQLNLKSAHGLLDKPKTYDRHLELLREKGQNFENDFLKNIKESGLTVFDASELKQNPEAIVKAMQEGYDYIYQAYLTDEQWHGYADFLCKVETKSTLGNFSYEVVDTKLSTNTKAGSLLQIGLYSELVAKIQGVSPEYMHIRNPEDEFHYRVNDYQSYLNLVKKQLITATRHQAATYPHLCGHCNICDWWDNCNAQRRADDHLSFVAGIKNSHIKELAAFDINTLDALSNFDGIKAIKPKKGSKHSFVKIQNQAKLQKKSAEEGVLNIEFNDIKSNIGFSSLPEPHIKDCYIQIEFNPFINPNGLYYQFSMLQDNGFESYLISEKKDEKKRFENFINQLIDTFQTHPKFHIYTYDSSSVTALKRLATQYASKENELDQLLRSECFIDLQRVLKQSVQIGVEKYNLRSVEKLYQYQRASDFRKISKAKSDFEFILQTNQTDSLSDEIKHLITENHSHDLASLQQLHLWLEKARTTLINEGHSINRPVLEVTEEPESVSAHLLRIAPLFDALMKDVPDLRQDRENEQQARYILAHFLDWYRREEKSFWWEYFRILNLEPDELLDEKTALTYLSFTGERENVKKSVIDSYQFPSQENELKVGCQVKDENGNSAGEIVEIDEKNNIIKIKKGPKIAENHPFSIIKFELFLTKDKVEAIVNFAEWIVQNGFRSLLPDYQVVRSILLNDPPRFSQPLSNSTTTLEQSIDWVSKLDRSYLPIQGPPGAGKSFTASRMILHLIEKGYKIGITALSHKVISNLLYKVKETADEQNLNIKTLYKSSGTTKEDTFWDIPKSTSDLVSKISDYSIIAGTSFMWCHPDLMESVDYLFVDEAGQYALIETMVVAKAAKNVVLLGDHQQLKQPIQGLHPDGTEVSALEHLLQGEATVPKDKGIFLEKTWRMHPSICSFDSEMFYESRLEAVDILAQQRIESNSKINGAGLFYQPVSHSGNTNYSLEEVDAIEACVKNLTQGSVFYYDKNNNKHLLKPHHIKIITPYNSQVFELEKRLPQIEIGTVDKFQGQEAPIILYSIASSSVEDAPRGMDFLYSPNRFNVAVSRAQIAFILFGNPSIFEPNCQSPEQIKLANPFCRFKEMATPL